MQDRDGTAGTGEDTLLEDNEEGQVSFERDASPEANDRFEVDTGQSLNSGENEEDEQHTVRRSGRRRDNRPIQ
jgi:hypothetical protein